MEKSQKYFYSLKSQFLSKYENRRKCLIIFYPQAKKLMNETSRKTNIGYIFVEKIEVVNNILYLKSLERGIHSLLISYLYLIF